MNLLSRNLAWCLIVAVLCASAIRSNAKVKISGKIAHPVSDSIQFSYNDNKLAYYPKDLYARLDKKGNFSVVFPAPGGIYILAEVKHGRHLSEIILRDGDSLVLSVDAVRFDSSLHFSGRGGDIQNFVVRHIVERGRLNQYSVRIKNHLEKNPDDFLKAIEKEKSDELAFVGKNKGRLPSSFIDFWQSHYTYYNYFFLQQYPQLHQMIKLRRYTDTIPDENFVVLQQMPLSFHDSLLAVPSYLLYLTGVFELPLKAAGYAYPLSNPANASKFLDSVDKLGYTRLPDKSGEYFIAQSLYARIRRQPIERTRAEFAAFKKRWPGSEYLAVLGKQVDMTERLAAGQPAPDLDFVTADGLHKKLSDFKDKVVYITFWAPWCKPCVGEMRAMERKVKEVLKNKPVEFVYVSIDDDTATAKLLLGQFKIEGNFTWTKGGWYSPEVAAYGVQNLPAYFLIDREGKFAVQPPPTPQQPTELIVAISKLY